MADGRQHRSSTERPQVVTQSQESKEDRGSSEKSKGVGELYDFKRPGRLTKEQLRGINTIHDNFSRALGTYLTTLLRTIVDVRFMSVNQFVFLEFIDALSDPDCVWVFSVEDLDGKGILEISPSLVLLLVERAFGGEARAAGEARIITTIEQRIAHKMIKRLMELYGQAWERAAPLRAWLESFEADPRLAQIASASESCVVFSWEIVAKESSYGLNICLPLFVIDPILRKLSAQTWLTVTPRKSTPDTRRNIENVVGNTNLLLRAFLGGTTVSARELLGFKVGDVVVLNQKIQSPLRIDVGNKQLLLGRAGVTGKNRAVQIIDWIKAEVRDDG